jgi:hypothetical protein
MRRQILAALSAVTGGVAMVAGLLLLWPAPSATPSDAFWTTIHEEYPHLTEAQATGWVQEVCGILREGYTLADMPKVDELRRTMYLFLLREGVPVFCPAQAGALNTTEGDTTITTTGVAR